MRDLVTIGEHTVDASLLVPGGWVLDAGCRDFTFARGMVERGMRVVSVDADWTVEDPKIEGVEYKNVAVSVLPGRVVLAMTEDPQARHVVKNSEGYRGRVAHILAVTVEDLLRNTGAQVFDVAKLDVEGSEYAILEHWPGPIARQISVEFHEHCWPRPQSVYDAIFSNLEQWYDVVQHEKTARHCCAPNYWDSLFVLKPELR